MPADDALQDYPLLFSGLAEVLAHLGTQSFPGSLATLMERASGYDSTVLAAFPASGRPLRLFSNLPPDEEETTLRPYFHNTYLLDPWYNMARAAVPDGVYRLADCVPDNFLESNYYLDFYRATLLVDECGLFVRLSDTVCFVAMLGIREAGRSGRLDTLQLLLPCLREVVRRHWAGIASIAVVPMENLQSLCAARRLIGREVQVTEHLLRGYSNKLIARELGISPETVTIYRKRINRKLGTSSTREVFALFFGHATGVT